MQGLIVTLIVVGLIAGALARLLMPGKQDISIVTTIVLGIVGSFVGGFLGYALFHNDFSGRSFQPSGLVGSVMGAVIVLLIWTRVGSGRASSRHTGTSCDSACSVETGSAPSSDADPIESVRSGAVVIGTTATAGVDCSTRYDCVTNHRNDRPTRGDYQSCVA
jgi:uncharacterized membrane protein YeaQ/YmgE (transglycosylase-associated protein family)